MEVVWRRKDDIRDQLASGVDRRGSILVRGICVLGKELGWRSETGSESCRVAERACSESPVPPCTAAFELKKPAATRESRAGKARR